MATLSSKTGLPSFASSASGAGRVNYFANSGFEIDATTGVSLYADTPGIAPIDGTGGSPLITVSRITAGPLNGVGSLEISKPASNRQGDGVAFACVVPAGYVQSRKCEYTLLIDTTHANYVAGDLDLYIYDVTNNTLINPSTIDIPKMRGPWTVSWDSSGTGSSYRAIIHCAATHTNAFTVKIDDVIVGPSNIQQGFPGGIWRTYTPVANTDITTTSGSIGFGTIVANKVTIWRNGPNATIRWDYSHSSIGSAGAGRYQFTMPAGLTIDTSLITPQLVTGGVGTGGVGTLTVTDDTNEAWYSAQVATATTIEFRAPTTGVWSNSATCIFSDAILKASFIATVPITEWANGTVNLINPTVQSPIRAGMVQTFAGSTTPAGWLDCDGSAYAQTLYPQLFAQIGATWATCTNPLTGSAYSAPSAGNFRVPDLRGVFVRGVGGPNVAGVTTTLAGYQADTTAVNGLVNSASASLSGTAAAQSITHAIKQANAGAIGGSGTDYCITSGGSAVSITAAASSISGTAAAQSISGNPETRPDNVGLRYIIKAWDESFNVAGFGFAGTDGSSGFVSAGRVPGLVTGAAVPAGFVGEVRTLTSRTVTGTSGTWAVNASALDTLTAGVWLVCAQFVTANASATSYVEGAIATNSTADGTGIITSASVVMSSIATASNSWATAMRVVVLNVGSSQSIFAKSFSEDAAQNATLLGIVVRIA